jgi:hypothetical protein
MMPFLANLPGLECVLSRAGLSLYSSLGGTKPHVGRQHPKTLHTGFRDATGLLGIEKACRCSKIGVTKVSASEEYHLPRGKICMQSLAFQIKLVFAPVVEAQCHGRLRQVNMTYYKTLIFFTLQK